MDRIIKHVQIKHAFDDVAPSEADSDADVPSATNNGVVPIDVTISESGGGYMLEWNGDDPRHCGDDWFEDLSNAEAAAEERFGIASEDWESPEEDY
jgi:hypothetical protein